jgi:hypothetical protein
MVTPCVTSLDFTSGPFFGVKMKPRDLHHYTKELLAPRDARDDFHFLEDELGREGPHKFVSLRSVLIQISNSPTQIGFSEAKVDHDSQFLDHGSQFRSLETREFQLDGFPFISNFSSVIWPRGSSFRSLLSSTHRNDDHDESDFRSSFSFNCIHDNKGEVYTARLQQTCTTSNPGSLT